MLRLSLLLGWRHLGADRLRQALSAAGIVLGVATVTAVWVSNRSVVLSYREVLAGLAGRADLQVTPLSESGLPAALVRELQGAEGVRAAVPLLKARGSALALDRAVPIVLYGIDPRREPRVRPLRLLAGRLPLPGEGGSVALGRTAAEGLGSAEPGDLVALEAEGRMAAFTVVGILDEASSLGRASGGGGFAVLPLPAAQAWLGRRGAVDQLDLLLAAGRGAGEMRARLQRQVGRAARVDTPWADRAGLGQQLAGLQVLTVLIGGLACFAGLAILVSNRAASLRQRRRELAALRVLGLRRRDLLLLLLAESALLGAAGAAVGIPLGVLWSRLIVGWAARDFLAALDLQAGRMAVEPAALAALALATVAVAVASTWTLARRAAQEVLGGPPGAPGAPGGTTSVARRARAAFRLAPDHLPLVHRLAVAAVAEAPARSALIVAGLALPLALLIAVGSIAASQRAAVDAWFRRSIGWDFAVQRSSYSLLGSQAQVPDELASRLAGVPGISGVSPQKFGVIGVGGRQAVLWVLDSGDLAWYGGLVLVDGDPARALARLERGGAVLVSVPLARRHGLGVGGRLALQTAAGERSFEVAGILPELGAPGGTVQMDRADYERWFGPGRFSQLVLKTGPGASPEQVRPALEQVVARYPQLRLISRQEAYRDAFAILDGFYRVLDALAAVALLAGVMALVNGQLLALLERQPVLALMRAGGMLRRQLLASAAGEGLLLGASAGLLGVVLGLAGGWAALRVAAVAAGISLEFEVPWGTLGFAALLSLAVPPLCALLPARRAAAAAPSAALGVEAMS